jgi:hypothetical protein
MEKVKVHVLLKCRACNGAAYLPVEEETDWMGQKYLKHRACATCEASGLEERWLELPDFLLLLEQLKCAHEHTTRSGGFHYSGGEVWDDVSPDICSDCGKVLE